MLTVGAPTTPAPIPDSGASAHFFPLDNAPAENITPLAHPLPISTPDGATMYATHFGTLTHPPELPAEARLAYLVPNLQSHPLLSMGVLCDAGCTVHFTKDTVIIQDAKERILLRGHRDPTNNLWTLPPPSALSPRRTEANNLAVLRVTPKDRVAFAHASLFSPTISTLTKALQKQYITGFPGLTVDTLKQHPPVDSIAMHKGHLDQTRKNRHSTSSSPETELTLDDFFPEIQDDTSHERTHLVCATIFQPTGKFYSDMTGKFVAPSSTGKNYILIVYDYDSNSIQAIAMQSRSKAEHLSALKTAYANLVQAGCRPRLHFMDNECSDLVKDFMRSKNIDFQLVPPDTHRRNAAERAIRTFKNHFIAGLCSTDPGFPIHLWDRLLPQATLSLNLLRGSRINPKLSAYSQLWGPYDFNRTPIAPPGCKVLIHEKPHNRGTWAPHASEGWYLGPALEAYRCFTVYSTDTRHARTADTVQFLPHVVPVPVASATDLITASLQDILQVLKHPAADTPVVPPTARRALQDLHEIFAPNSPPPEPVDPGTVRTQTTTDRPADNTALEQAAPVSPTPAPVSPLRVRTPSSPASPLRVPRLPRIVSPPASPERHGTAINDMPTPRTRNTGVPATNPTTPISAPAPNTPPAPVGLSYGSLTGRAARNTKRREAAQKRRTSDRPKRNSPPASLAESAAAAPLTHSHQTRQARHGRRPTILSRAGLCVASSALHAMLLPSEMPLFALHGNAFNPDTGTLAEYPELSRCSDGPRWIQGNTLEIRRLLATQTIRFIPKAAIPAHKRATYLRVVCAFRPEKDDPYRVRWTVGGNLIEYLHDASTKTADLTTVKCLINSVLSTPNARFLTADLKDFYLGTPLADPEYMRVHTRMLPPEIIAEYDLHHLIHNDHVVVEINKGMYGLPQAGRIANDYLTELLAPAGYTPAPLTPGLWTHASRPISFSLVVDDFGIKYINQADVDHLLDTLRQRYECKVDPTGARYCGLHLDWDYHARTCDLSIPGYVERALKRFTHPTPVRREDAPHRWTRPDYGAKIQYAQEPDASPTLDKDAKRLVQEVIGVFLFYARAVDLTMLPALGTLAAQQSAPTKHTIQALTQFLNYAASHPDAIIRYRASDMILSVESDCSYLSEPKARSRWAGFHFLGEHNDTGIATRLNGPIHVPCQILKEIVSSAAEGELAGVFHNAKEACPIRICLDELGHPQPATPLITDNTTAAGIANDTVKQKRSKAMDMRFYWIRDRIRQKQFNVFWRKGALNRADYMTKHHPAQHHRKIRSAYLHDPNSKWQNYFEVLQETEFLETRKNDATAEAHSATDKPEPDTHGEGVLIPSATAPAGASASLSPCSSNHEHRSH
jgi:hypothetical protein